MSKIYIDVSDSDRNSVNKMERNLNLVSDSELAEFAFSLLVYANEAKMSNFRMAWTDSSGKVVSYLEQDKKNPAQLKMVPAAPAAP